MIEHDEAGGFIGRAAVTVGRGAVNLENRPRTGSQLLEVSPRLRRREVPFILFAAKRQDDVQRPACAQSFFSEYPVAAFGERGYRNQQRSLGRIGELVLLLNDADRLRSAPNQFGHLGTDAPDL